MTLTVVDSSGAPVPPHLLERFERMLAGRERPDGEFLGLHPGLRLVDHGEGGWDLVRAAPPPGPGERCPASEAGVPLVALQGTAAGVVAFYEDGSVWHRPDAPAGPAAWRREHGPAWLLPPAGSRTLALVKPRALRDDPVGSVGLAVARAAEAGLVVARLAHFRMSLALAGEVYREHAGRDYHARLMDSVVGRCAAIVLEGEDAVARWRAIIGPSDPAARERHHLRHAHSPRDPSEYAQNGYHGSDSPAAAEREIEALMGALRTGEDR